MPTDPSNYVPPWGPDEQDLFDELDRLIADPYGADKRSPPQQAKHRAMAEELLEEIASSGFQSERAQEYASLVLLAVRSANTAKQAFDDKRGAAFIRAAGLKGQRDKYLDVAQHVGIAGAFGVSMPRAIDEAMAAGMVPPSNKGTHPVDKETLRVKLVKRRGRHNK